MKARTLVPVEVRNPIWSEAEFHAARNAGQVYPIPATLEVDPGYELEGPDAWMHCCPGDLNAPPIAEPIDDECRDAVRIWMETKRPAAIEAIRQALKNINSYKNPDDRARLTAMGKAYGLIGAETLQKKESKKPAADPAA